MGDSMDRSAFHEGRDARKTGSTLAVRQLVVLDRPLTLLSRLGDSLNILEDRIEHQVSASFPRYRRAGGGFSFLRNLSEQFHET